MAKEAGKPKAAQGSGASRQLLAVGVVFALAATFLFVLVQQMPQMPSDELGKIKLPRNLDDAKALCSVLVNYKDDYVVPVVGIFIATYVFLQSFSIPGTIFLNIIAGALFDLSAALPLVCLCAALGASGSYLLSAVLGTRLMAHYFPDRVRDWKAAVDRHRRHLFFYVIFLRLTPLVPNWFVNLAAPVVGIPLAPFFFGTFFGVMVPSLLAVRAGAAIQDLTSTSEIATWRTGAWLTLAGLVLLVPIVLRDRLKKLN